MKPTQLGLLVALGAIWGMSYVFIRVAAPVVGPVPLMAFRFAVGGAILTGYVVVTGKGRALWDGLRTQWKEFLLLGLFLMAFPTVLIGYAELGISASLASVLNASVPFFAAAAAFVLLGELMSFRQVGGLVLGFAGVAVAVGGVALNLGWNVVPFAAGSIVAAASYGVASVYIQRSRLRTIGTTSSAAAQLMATALLVPLVPITVQSTHVSPAVIGSALGLALLSTAVAYIIYFHLIETVGPTQASTVTFISPIAGILGGAALLGEPVGYGLVVGLALIFTGILLSSRELGILERLRRRASV